MAFDQGASRPQSTITAKSTTQMPGLKLKKIKRTSLFFILIIFLFSAKSGGGGALCTLYASSEVKVTRMETYTWLLAHTSVVVLIIINSRKYKKNTNLQEL